jgi:tRNA dimethylallyltransferase
VNANTLLDDKEIQALIHNFELPLKQKIPTPTKKKKVMVISGPTGVGKSEMSLIIAKVIGGEIISADSMQIYRGMNIGTAKLHESERAEIPHHLIDIRSLQEGFNVKDFHTEAMRLIHEVLLRGHVPIVVGGTGFYIHALLYGPPSGPPSVASVRDELEKEMGEKGALILYERLRDKDPDYAETITMRDRHKIIRALEIITLTGQKVSSLKPASCGQENYDFRCWFVYMPKETLYPRLDARCEKMIQLGFIDEVRKLEEEGLRNNQSASNAIGYRQCLEFLRTSQSEEELERFVNAFKQATRRYAKRQFTWFRKEPLFRWLNLDSIARETAIEMIIQDYELSF